MIGLFPRKSVSRPKKHTLTQQLSVLILYHIHDIRIDVLTLNISVNMFKNKIDKYLVKAG